MNSATYDRRHFRIHWLTLCTLLRATGHVLDKVDAESSQKMRSAIDDWWRRLNADKFAHPIFWESIDAERNRVIKTYDPTYYEGGMLRAFGGAGVIHGEPIDPALYTPSEEGAYAGEDARDVVGLAIYWWESQFEMIERSASGS
jgi:hypothetical protein